MPPRNRPPKFTTVAHTAPAASEPLTGPDSPPVSQPTMSDAPDIASKLASNIGHQRTSEDDLSVLDLFAGPPDEYADRTPVNVRVRRVIANALDMEAKRSRRPRQDIVDDALSAYLPDRLIDMARRKLYGDRA